MAVPDPRLVLMFSPQIEIDEDLLYVTQGMTMTGRRRGRNSLILMSLFAFGLAATVLGARMLSDGRVSDPLTAVGVGLWSGAGALVVILGLIGFIGAFGFGFYLLIARALEASRSKNYAMGLTERRLLVIEHEGDYAPGAGLSSISAGKRSQCVPACC